jgi:hypothetical protein
MTISKANIEKSLADLGYQQRVNSLTRRLAHATKNGTKTDVKLLNAALNRARKDVQANAAQTATA